MRKALLILLLTFSLPSFAQIDADKSFSILKKEVQWFIDTVKSNTLGSGVHNVYTVYLYSAGGGHFCFSISYMQNSVDYMYSISPYIFMLGNEIVLIQNTKNVPNAWIDRNYTTIVDSFEKTKLKNKLAKGFSILRECAEPKLLCWYEGDFARRRFCDSWWGRPNIIRLEMQGRNNCTYDDFNAVKQSFYDDSVYDAATTPIHRYPDK